MNTAVYKRLNEERIEIPYAKQDLYIRGLPEFLSRTLRTLSTEPQKASQERKSADTEPI